MVLWFEGPGCLRCRVRGAQQGSVWGIMPHETYAGTARGDSYLLFRSLYSEHVRTYVWSLLGLVQVYP